MLENQQLNLVFCPTRQEILILGPESDSPLGAAQKFPGLFQTRILIRESSGNPLVFHMTQGIFSFGRVQVFDAFENRIGWFFPESLFHHSGMEWANLEHESKIQSAWKTTGNAPLAKLIQQGGAIEIHFKNIQPLSPFARMMLLGNAIWRLWQLKP